MNTQMKRNHFRNKKVMVLLFFLLGVVFVFLWSSSNGDELWKIVSAQCIPNQSVNRNPNPCLKVDLLSGYALLKDIKGPIHDLLIPTHKISGIESSDLDKSYSPPFFYYAWRERKKLESELERYIDDSYISLAVNSYYGRSQEQLHIHMACLSDDVFKAIKHESANIGLSWAQLDTKLKNHTYIARRLDSGDLITNDPIKLLNEYILERGEQPGDYGLALTSNGKGGFILLASKINPLELNFGSAGEIQDLQCALANNA